MSKQSFREVLETLCMPEKVFLDLLKKIRCGYGSKKKVNAEDYKHRLIATLLYLSNGTKTESIMEWTQKERVPLEDFIIDICNGIKSALEDQLVFPGSKDEWVAKAEEFDGKFGLKACFGSITGKYVLMRHPPKETDGDKCFLTADRQNSLSVMAMADSKFKFLSVDVGVKGRESNEKAWESSSMFELLSVSNFNYPDYLFNRYLNLSYYFVADQSVPLDRRFMTPFVKPESEMEEKYSKTLTDANTAKIGYDILSYRFKIIPSSMKYQIDEIKSIVLACASLHNLLIEKNPEQYLACHTEGEIYKADNVTKYSPTALPRRTEIEDTLGNKRRVKFMKIYNGLLTQEEKQL